ncbi:DUF4988 domain-containing protein [Phocaeicola vulgatus]|uniref:PL29 family lyase N-terminal domain-containing protein n=1 Tax=Phocaeicola vulgatus TaxID=821 RepID=UPI001C38F433|nr:DUF4988 domain-containing protein [Phocaeicola vulgatus]MBV4064076.1 DUF4988 domain-containing protein [Phocaeicola vulgatus]MBV4115024.1 DUF4988 domain-containing protein [Phocaeicola vulgatus]MDU7567872.1 hypothetical protein [Bacteroides sp.]
MNKKFLSAVLFGALMVSSTGTFVSCKDYDEDIDRIDKELVDIKSALSALQAKVDAGKYVTNVVKNGDGITVTWSDNSTSTIETIKGDKGEDGKNGTVVTIIDGYWAFDGVKSEYPAKGDKGDKGDQGEPGDAAAAGHDAKVNEETGYWQVWDAEKGAYVDTKYIAGGLRVVEVAGGYNFTVTEANGEPKTIFIPNSADLVSIQDARDSQAPYGGYDIFYGLVNADVDWNGHKAVNGKMQAGMYPVLDRDIEIMLNPTGVDGTAYNFDFTDSDNKKPWGLELAEIQPYAGGKLTRAASSEGGIWVLPRHIERVPLEALNERADYITQFKANDGSNYAFALNAASKGDPSKVIKSQYIYSFDPTNIGNLKADGFAYSVLLDKYNYVWNQWHKPNFEAWQNGQLAVGNQYVKLSQVVYDYRLDINTDKMTKVNIEKYGLKVSDDHYTFAALKEAAVDNKVSFKLTYILVNGSKKTVDFDVIITNKDLVIENKAIGSINRAFDAKKLAAGQTIQTLDGHFVYADKIDFNVEEVLGGNYDEWIDAMYQNLRGISSNVDRARILKHWTSIVGGDPINNDAEYNNALISNLMYFDYVDAAGKSCVYNVPDVTNDANLLSRLAAIKSLKVYFIAGTYGPATSWNVMQKAVKAPYYTIDGTQNWSTSTNGFAIPLNNAFRVEVGMGKEDAVVGAFNFTFQLTQPALTITHENDKFSVWSEDNNGYETLTSYGAYANNKMYLPMYEAFKAWTTEYTVYDANAEYYNVSQNTVADVTLLGKGQNVVGKFDSDLKYSTTWNAWNTYVNDARVTYDVNGKQVERKVVVEPIFHHFGVYPEDQVKDFDLVFASLLNHSSLKMVEGKETMITKTGTHEVFISNSELNLTTPMNGKFFLFDGIDANEKVVKRATLNEQSFNEEQRPFMLVSNVTNIANFTAKAKNGSTTYQFQAATASWTIDPQTGKVDYAIGTPDATKIKVYTIDAVAKRQAVTGEVLDPTKTMVGGHTGGMVIQLPKAVADQEEVEITLTISDDLGFKKDLKFVVKKIQ